MKLPCLALITAALLAACAQLPDLSTGPAARNGPTDEAAINALYATIDASVRSYQDGLEAAAKGRWDSAHKLIEEAVESLAVAGSQCAETPGCEPQRFMSAYSNLLTQRSSVLTGAMEEFVEVEKSYDEESIVLAEIPSATRSVNLLNGQDLREIIELNGPVNAAMHDWLTWMRPNLIDAWENYQYLRHLMWPEYEQAGLPEALLFGIMAKESGGRVHSVSRAGAAGPLQFMPHTGRRFGLDRDDGFDQRFDPALASRASVAYLNERFQALNDNLELALAAYNGGENRIQRLVRQSSGASFWDAEIRAQLPRETQDYVPYVLAAAWLFLHPQEYGVEFPEIRAEATTVALAEPATLGELAICLGQHDSRNGWFRTLRNLNPRQEPFDRLDAGTRLVMPAQLESIYQARCVEGGQLSVAAVLHESRDDRRPPSRIYTVRSGDTLSTIVSRNGCPSVQTVASENNIRPPSFMIRPGQQLKLTGCRS
ncbi:MAG: transglycosylase SLT domain-containing protein [Gammaproteobacteria bacterium]|nr:transglycosylase SLT domain-containing protein [Gammaproteobacteria bacterium]